MPESRKVPGTTSTQYLCECCEYRHAFSSYEACATHEQGYGHDTGDNAGCYDYLPSYDADGRL